MSRRIESCPLIVRVQPRASRTEVSALMPDGSFRVRLKAPPVEGKANRELVAFLACVLGIPASSIRIVKGLTSRQKSLVIEGMKESDVHEILKRGLARDG